MNIETRREPFFDRYLIERMDGTEHLLHRPNPEGTALRFDRPWEGSFSLYGAVLADSGRYRMYYRGTPNVAPGREKPEVTCYAESADGVDWEKPNLGLFEVNGSRDNNVVLSGYGGVHHNFCPFIDTNPEATGDERYKAMAGTKRTGVIPFASADGIHWKRMTDEPVIRAETDFYALDSQNVPFWSELERCYVFYFRTWEGGASAFEGVRSIARMTSKDFVHWSEPVVMDFGEPLTQHLYINATQPYPRAPHIYVALPARFMPGRQALSDEEGESLGILRYGEGKQKGVGRWHDISETVFMTSRGGNRYDWPFKEALVRPGLDRRRWVARDNYAYLGIVPTGPKRMSIYVQREYTQPSTYLERLSLRTDGFASVHAPYSGGEMLTRVFSFGGTELCINFSTGVSGFVRVEVQDEAGRPIPGFAAAESREMIGDEIERVVRWMQEPELARLAGTPVRLRFVMKDADLYSIRFRENR